MTDKPIVNEATGEVSFRLSGKEYRIRATLAGLAALQAELAVPGLTLMQMMIKEQDMRAIHGVRCLLTHGDPAELGRELGLPNLALIMEALLTALQHGLPDLEKETHRGNGEATAAMPTH
jgi:hypothetical protein